MSVSVELKADFGALHGALQAFQVKQVPFATALALTRLAQGVQKAEGQQVAETFDNPTPFTQNAFAVTPATKASQIAYVYAKDIAAQYLLPYVEGGMRFLGKKKAMLVPKGVAVNQYGNLTRGKLSSLKGKPNVFVGKIRTKDGRTVSGVWQRPGPMAKKARRSGEQTPRGKLKLLIRFEDTTPAQKHLLFVERARAYIQANAREEIERAFRIAARTTRR